MEIKQNVKVMGKGRKTSNSTNNKLREIAPNLSLSRI